MRMLIDGFRTTAASEAGRDRRLSPVVLILWSRLGHTFTRFEALVIKARAKQPPAAAPRTEDAAKLPAKPPVAKPVTAEPVDQVATPKSARPPLPSGFGWAVRQIPNVAVYGSQLQFWLTDPELPALLEVEPRLGRLLRPLCNMLGIAAGPAALPKRPRSPRARPSRAKLPQAAETKIRARWPYGARHAPPGPKPSWSETSDEWPDIRKRW